MVVLALVALVLAGWASYRVPAVAVIGDSYTQGSSQGGVGEYSWPEVAWRLMREQGVRVAPEISAVGGTGYLHKGLTQAAFSDLIKEAVRPDDKVVVIFGGMNDTGEPINEVSIAVRQAFELVHERAPRARLVVIGPVWPGRNPERAVLAVRDVIRAHALNAGAVFVDPIQEGWFTNRPDLIGADHIHPTDAGAVYLAERIAPRITEVLTGTARGR
ncbi:SGNH/GDSL hydrolase family protein [Mycolicibacterium phocaicum]|uniref:SGNH/GDSL hydrolase family protein n=1 Tax=Mycolicibacterium phocaicum TaxID=319706 RepID=UPI0014769E94|nr:SGNH/GDSL hydrolase family protein [Mycolicibacterium phocaicum]